MTEGDPRARQVWNAEDYEKHARFVSDLAGPVLEWLQPQAGQRILDLGCGDGVLTEELKRRGVDVLGVDVSESLLAAALARGVETRRMDGQKLPFDAEFDAVFSNAALHWMSDAGAVIEGVFRALKPGGRFVAEFGGHGNVAAVTTAMRATARRRGGDAALAGPWFFPSVAVYREMLEERGFRVVRIGLFPRPTPLPTGMIAWLKVFRRPFFAQYGAEEDQVLAEVEELLAPSLRDARGNWTADYVRLRVEAVKP
ncbi:MAG TPA: methyltransferase domain-containing protein [Aestuariivirgaceae bacterium]|jgi:trans-aconitate methyltransferase|nr:methyltransferase domain-containing protein [Aestuariivirgaceae bacterium]